MQRASLALSGASITPPVLLAGAVVLSFFLCHYSAERRNRREFLRWCAANGPRPLAETLAEPANSGDLRWSHSSGLYGVGTAARGFRGAADAIGPFILKHARGYALAILFVGLVLGARLLLEPVLEGRLPYLFFSAAILFTAMFAGIWETLLALILGFLAAEWFVVEPRYSFMISGTHGWLGAVLYFVLGLGIVWFKRSESAATMQAMASDIAYLDRLKELDQDTALRTMLAHIVETSDDAVFSLMSAGRILTWNAAAGRLLGYSAKEAVGHPLALLLPAEEQPRVDRILESIQKGQPAQPWQATLNRKDGSRVEVSLAASAAHDAAGKVVGISVVARPRSPAAGR